MKHGLFCGNENMVHAIKKDICLLMALAVAARMFCVLNKRGEDIQFGDQSEYVALAQNLRYHGSFSFGEPHAWGGGGHLNTLGPFVPTAARAPLYPILLAALWWGGGPPVLGMRLLQILMGAATVLLTYLIAKREFGRRVGLIAGIGMAFHPLSCYLTTQILSETLFTFLLTIGIWFWGGRRAYLAGVFFGFAALTRPALLPFLILMALYACVCVKQRQFVGKIAMAAILIIAPWTIRNYVAFQKIIPISTSGWGAQLLFGTLDLPSDLTNKWRVIRSDLDVAGIIEGTNNETEAEKLMMTAAVQKIKKAPFQWAVKRVLQSYRFFIDQGVYTYDMVPIPKLVTRILFVIGSVMFWLLALLGGFKAHNLWRQLMYLLSIPIYFIIFQFPVLGLSRFSQPLIPSMMIFVAVIISKQIDYSNK